MSVVRTWWAVSTDGESSVGPHALSSNVWLTEAEARSAAERMVRIDPQSTIYVYRVEVSKAGACFAKVALQWHEVTR